MPQRDTYHSQLLKVASNFFLECFFNLFIFIFNFF